MRTFEEMDRDARPGSPFSNSTEGECWTANWCGFRLGDQYHCIEFRDERDGPSDPPAPSPQIPGQGLLFDPEPYEGVRMFADVVDEIRPVEAHS